MTPDFRFPFRRDRHDCEETRALLSDYLDDDLDERLHGKVDRHVHRCPRCRRVLGNLRATIDRLAHLDSPAHHLDSRANEEPDDEVAARLSRTWRERENGSPPAP